MFSVIHVKGGVFRSAEQISSRTKPVMTIGVRPILNLLHTKPAKVTLARIASHFITARFLRHDSLTPGALFSTVLDKELLSHFIAYPFLHLLKLLSLICTGIPLNHILTTLTRMRLLTTLETKPHTTVSTLAHIKVLINHGRLSTALFRTPAHIVHSIDRLINRKLVYFPNHFLIDAYIFEVGMGHC